MTDSMGGINKLGMNYSPVSSYNKLLENNLGSANFEGANESLNDFQNILNTQMSNLNMQGQQADPFTMGISMDVNAVNPHSNSVQKVDSRMVTAISSDSPVSSTANDFSKALSNGISSLNNKQVEAQKAVETLASGGDISVHDVMIASQKASLNMQMAMQLRNKILTAYNELYQMRF